MDTPIFNPFNPDTAIESPLIVTVDIESTDTAVTSKVLTIGAVAGNILTGDVLGEFYQRIDLNSQPERTSSQSTLDFWQDMLTQFPLAHKECFDPTLERVSLETALTGFNDFVTSMGKFAPAHIQDDKRRDNIHVYGNGPEFDNAILTHAMDAMGMRTAWKYGANQSLRTAVSMGRLLLGIDPKYTLKFTGEKHHSLHDARHEWEFHRHIMKAFMERLGITMAENNTKVAS